MYHDQASDCLNYLLNSPDLPSPCFVLDVERLLLNINLLGDIQKKTGVKILLALKGFAAWSVFPLLSRSGSGCLWGTCVSSADEARLAHEKFGGEIHAFAAAFDDAEMRELMPMATHISFNSVSQLKKYAPRIQAFNNSFRKHDPLLTGLRVNPEHSEGAPDIYNPCAPGSRLGVRKKQMPSLEDDLIASVQGLHFHTLCEQDSSALTRTLAAFENSFSPYFPKAQWFNFGGGHHITRDGYNVDLLCLTLLDWQKKYKKQIYLEPGEAVALDAGWLLTTVLDIVDADMPVLVLDSSAACHMPDVLEMPYTPDLWYKSSSHPFIKKAGRPEENNFTCRLAGRSCLAGDIIGEYSFDSMPKIGDKLVFADMAIYSMVKTNTFNGLRLPSIAVHDYRKTSPFRVVRAFSYDDFKNRLS